MEHVHPAAQGAARVELAAIHRGPPPAHPRRSLALRPRRQVQSRVLQAHRTKGFRRARLTQGPPRSVRVPPGRGPKRVQPKRHQHTDRHHAITQRRARRRDPARPRHATKHSGALPRLHRGLVSPRTVPNGGWLRGRSLARHGVTRVQGPATRQLQGRREAVAGRHDPGVRARARRRPTCAAASGARDGRLRREAAHGLARRREAAAGGQTSGWVRRAAGQAVHHGRWDTRRAMPYPDRTQRRAGMEVGRGGVAAGVFRRGSRVLRIFPTADV